MSSSTMFVVCQFPTFRSTVPDLHTDRQHESATDAAAIDPVKECRIWENERFIDTLPKQIQIEWASNDFSIERVDPLVDLTDIFGYRQCSIFAIWIAGDGFDQEFPYPLILGPASIIQIRKHLSPRIFLIRSGILVHDVTSDRRRWFLPSGRTGRRRCCRSRS